MSEILRSVGDVGSEFLTVIRKRKKEREGKRRNEAIIIESPCHVVVLYPTVQYNINISDV